MHRGIALAVSILLFFVPIFAAPGAYQPPAGQYAKTRPIPIVIGETIIMPPKVLADARQINIYLPPDYHNSDRTYPVLYLIDGGLEQDFLHIAGAVHLGALWARSRMAIVVGIETKDRRRDLTGPTRNAGLLKTYPTAGSSSQFRAFIRDEVMPVVEKSYRVTAENSVIGESLAGLFIVETYLREPALFDNYAAISPSLWWDDGRLAAEATQLMAGRPAAGPAFYLTIADEGLETQMAMEALARALKGKRQWCYAPSSVLTHATAYHAVSPQALQFLFPHPEKLNPRSGFIVACKAGPGRE